MDLAACAGVSLLEAVVLTTPKALDSPPLLRTLATLLLLQYLTLKIYRIVIYPRFLSPLRHVPGPTNYDIFLGQEVNKYKAATPVSIQLEWSKTWPDAQLIRYLSFCGKEVLMLNSVATCRAVLQTHCYDFIKPPFFARLVGEIVGIGLLFSEGDSHKQQRRLLAGPFSVPSTRKIVPLFQRKAKTLSDVFEHVIGDKPHESLEVMSVLSKTTMDIIGVASLGVELGELSDSATGFAEHYDRLLHQAPLGQLISVINSFVPIRRFVPLEASRRFVRSQNELRGMLRKLIQKRVSDMNGGNSKEVVEERSDLLSYMLEEAQQHQQQTGNRPWTEDDIIGHLLNFTAAGHETSSTMLTWSLYALATRHDVQDRLRAEARVLLKRSPKPDYDELSTLPFLNDFCREVLRIYSPSYLVSREAARDLVIEGVHIPKGTQLDVTLAVMHFHPHIWGEDAQVFNPDRRENITGDAASPYAWEPFIQGPRMCPGKNFAMIEIKAILVELINDWRFIGIEKNNEDRSLMTDEEAKLGNGIRLENPSLTYCPAGGLRVRFERT